MNHFLTRSLFSIAIFLSTTASATVISFDATNIAGNTWEYSYTVENDSLAVDIEEFTIFFDLGIYENLVIGTAPAGWDPLAIQPDPLLPDDGFYDALALGVGIASGASLGGFTVQFDFLGAGAPGSQFFNILDPFTFDLLDSGETVPAPGVGVPAPGALLLLAIGLLGLSRKRRIQN